MFISYNRISIFFLFIIFIVFGCKHDKIQYWDNGNKKEEGDYAMGRKDGEWVYYNYDGTPFIVVSYKDGVEVRYDGIQITDTKSGKD